VYVQKKVYATALLPPISPRIHQEFATKKPLKTLLTTCPETGKIHSIRELTPQMTAKCKHPIVKIVAREEDAEFVECQKCGEVFDSAEFSDIAIEEEESFAETPTDE
jgi:hypothetical protein